MKHMIDSLKGTENPFFYPKKYSKARFLNFYHTLLLLFVIRLNPYVTTATIPIYIIDFF